jgi:Tat protein translocase TatB subunit
LGKEVGILFLFIFESLGVGELLVIGAIALIVFGPRKLPQMARTVGKMMAEFRKATTDFKETWEKEVDFEDFKETKEIKNITPFENTAAKSNETEPHRIGATEVSVPEIREIKQEDLEKIFPSKEAEGKVSEQTAKAATGKQDWL